MKTLVFNVEDIFEEIEGDDENVLMNFPPEVLEHTGWKEGDTLEITAEDGKVSIKKV